jgi:hypothetical protein
MGQGWLTIGGTCESAKMFPPTGHVGSVREPRGKRGTRGAAGGFPETVQA